MSPVLEKRGGPLADFLKSGWPSQKDEAWRFTSLSPIAEEAFLLPEKPGAISEDQAKQALSAWLPARLVFVDGFFSPELSAPPRENGIEIESLAARRQGHAETLEPAVRLAAEAGCGLSHLAAALFQDGAYLRASPKAVLSKPVQLAFLWTASSAGRMSHPLVVIEAGPLSQMTVIEESASLGDGPCWRNRAAIITAQDGARLEYCHVQIGGGRSFETASTRVALAANARFHSRALTFGGELVRNDMDVRLNGEGGECVLDGLYAASGNEHVDNHTLIRHAAPGCVSRELYKGVLGGQAKAVFRGVIEVEPKAQKTDAMVYNKNLLLSEKGWVNTKPEFKIFANDVQCKHGSTIGRLPEEAVFYLRSRGLSQDRAREFLIRAFAQEMLDAIRPETLRRALSRRLGAEDGEG